MNCARREKDRKRWFLVVKKWYVMIVINIKNYVDWNMVIAKKNGYHRHLQVSS